MKPENPDPLDPMLEEQIIALLLDELQPKQASALRRQIEQNPALAAFHRKMDATLGLVRDTSTLPQETESPESGEARLSHDRRQALLSTFRAPKKTVAAADNRTLKINWFIPVGIAAAIVLIGLLAIPSFVKQRSGSYSQRHSPDMVGLSENIARDTRAANRETERTESILPLAPAKPMVQHNSGMAADPTSDFEGRRSEEQVVNKTMANTPATRGGGVYSANAVGYVNQESTAGLAVLSNPLDSPGSTEQDAKSMPRYATTTSGAVPVDPLPAVTPARPGVTRLYLPELDDEPSSVLERERSLGEHLSFTAPPKEAFASPDPVTTEAEVSQPAPAGITAGFAQRGLASGEAGGVGAGMAGQPIEASDYAGVSVAGRASGRNTWAYQPPPASNIEGPLDDNSDGLSANAFYRSLSPFTDLPGSGEVGAVNGASQNAASLDSSASGLQGGTPPSPQMNSISPLNGIALDTSFKTELVEKRSEVTEHFGLAASTVGDDRVTGQGDRGKSNLEAAEPDLATGEPAESGTRAVRMFSVTPGSGNSPAGAEVTYTNSSAFHDLGEEPQHINLPTVADVASQSSTGGPRSVGRRESQIEPAKDGNQLARRLFDADSGVVDEARSRSRLGELDLHAELENLKEAKRVETEVRLEERYRGESPAVVDFENQTLPRAGDVFYQTPTPNPTPAGAPAPAGPAGKRLSGAEHKGAAEKPAAQPQAKQKAAPRGNEAAPEPPAPEAVAPALQPRPEVLTAANPFSTFSLNVSDVAFKLAAASLAQNVMPDKSILRSEEFLNAFNYHDPAPLPDAKLAFAWEQAHSPFEHNRDLLRFSLQTAAWGRQQNQPLNLVLLLDNSGSMERGDRVEIVRVALQVLAQQLTPADRISVVAFARTPRLWVNALQGGNPDELTRRVGSLNPEGGTNLELALDLAYNTAQHHFLANGNNRVILLTDGAANLGDVNPLALKETVEIQRKKGIALDCFGIGWEGYNDDLLEVLSRNGDGRYGFINDPAAAANDFAGQLAGALRVAAANVKAQVEFNPERVVSYRQIGYEKHQLTKEQFRDNTVDAAEIGAAESGTALYSIQVNPEGSGPLGVVRVRYKVPATGRYEEEEWLLPHNPAVPGLDQAYPGIRLAAAASLFAEWLAGSPHAANVTLAGLQELLAGIPETFPNDPRPRQLLTMIQQARSLSGQ